MYTNNVYAVAKMALSWNCNNDLTLENQLMRLIMLSNYKRITS